MLNSPDLEVFVFVVVIGNQNIVLIVYQVDREVKWNTVSKSVEMNFTCSAIYDVEGNISFIETSQNSQICKIYILEEDFFSIEQRNVGSLISSESWSNFNYMLSSFGSKVPYSYYRLSHNFPAFDLVRFLCIKIKFFFG